MPRVNIVTSDRGWVLERLAREIESRVSYVRLGDDDDPSADIQYYITYSRRRLHVAPIEVAYFAHLETDKEAAQNFFESASAVDHCVCQATRYADLLRNRGHEHVSVISPGVDLDTYKLKLRIGVVGRTYHTGRKGEQIIAHLMDIPEIDWHFTGEGWPGPAKPVPEHLLADFYRDMDYILVPALYEGGPMCVVEALACGREVISSDVGWVSDFPHIAFENGNAEDLRRVLLELLERKRKLRCAVLDRTWDAWAEGHDHLFRNLLTKHGRSLPSIFAPTHREQQEGPRPLSSIKAALVMHGNEKKSQGGPSVRVPRTARELRVLGVSAAAESADALDLTDFDLIHLFNVWNPDSALALLHRGRTIDRPLVLSSIYLDLSERLYWDMELPKLLSEEGDRDLLDRELQIRAQHLAARRRSNKPKAEPIAGYHAKVREMVSLCDHVICLSDRERDLLASFGAIPKACTVVRNPVDADSFENGDPELFASTYGVRDYILCVARIEPRKNQLMLVHALRESGLPIVLVGHAPGSEYVEAIRRIGGSTCRIIDRIPHESELLRSAYAGARVAVLPSWCEGAPLAALEAAASGASLVLSDRSSEPEYFGDYALYCDPADPESIRDAVLRAYHEPRGAQRIAEQKAFVRSTYSWTRYTEATAEVYRQALESFASQQAARQATGEIVAAASRSARDMGSVRIVFDLTTSANHKGRWTGISRVEIAIARALKQHVGNAMAFVAWHNKDRRFISIPAPLVDSDSLKAWFASELADKAKLTTAGMKGAHYIVAGSAWMQNSNYANGIIGFARRHELRLTPLFHDIIPIKFPFWFDTGYAPVFERNLRSLLVAADRVIAISEATRHDLQSFYLAKEGRALPVDIFREGDEITDAGAGGDEHSPGEDLLSLVRDQRGFVLCVGAIHQRKNHRLLYECWVRLVARSGKRTPRLVIVGGVAWNGHDVARALREDQRIAGRVSILENVDDADLEWLYRNCLFTVYPSFYEGWGLPVAESLKYGKICIASNVASIPEIAPEVTDLLDPADIHAWSNRIAMYATSSGARAAREQEIVARYRARPWSEASSEIVDILRLPTPGRTAKAVYRVGEVISLNDPLALSRFGSGDWHLPESWGAWTGGQRAGFSVHFGTPAIGDLLLLIECQAHATSDRSFGCLVEVNGRRVVDWSFEESGANLISVRVPRNLFENSIDVSLINTHIDSIANLKPGAQDKRKIGIGVKRFALIDATADINPMVYFGDSSCLSAIFNPGDIVDFWRDNDCLKHFGSKLICNSYWGAFSNGALTRLRPHILNSCATPKIKLAVRGVATSRHPQFVTVLLNGVPVDRWEFHDSTVSSRELILQTDCFPPIIELLGENPISPNSLELGSEKESFCIGVLAIKLIDKEATSEFDAAKIEIDKSTPLTSTTFGTESPVLLGHEWYPAEETGTWMRGKSGNFQIKIPEISTTALHFHLDVRRFPSDKPEPDSIELIWNGISIGEIQATNDWSVSSTPIPSSVLRLGIINDVGLRISTSNSVYSIRANGDARDLGVMVRAICLASSPATTKQHTIFKKSPNRLRSPAKLLARIRSAGNRSSKSKTTSAAEMTEIE